MSRIEKLEAIILDHWNELKDKDKRKLMRASGRISWFESDNNKLKILKFDGKIEITKLGLKILSFLIPIVSIIYNIFAILY